MKISASGRFQMHRITVESSSGWWCNGHTFMTIASYSSFQMLRSQYTTNSLILTIISNYLFSSLLVHTLHQQLGWGLHKQNRGVDGRGGVYIHNHLVASQHNRSQRDIVRHSEPKRFDVDLFTDESFVCFANGPTNTCPASSFDSLEYQLCGHCFFFWFTIMRIRPSAKT